jgi:hypothetical protein
MNSLEIFLFGFIVGSLFTITVVNIGFAIAKRPNDSSSHTAGGGSGGAERKQ